MKQKNSKALAIFLSQNFFVYQKTIWMVLFISLYSYKLFFGTSAHMHEINFLVVNGHKVWLVGWL